MADGWTVAPPEQEGLDPKLICAIGPVFEQWQAADPHGIVIIRHGVLVYEHYFASGEVRWGPSFGLLPHDADTLHDLRSVTKSVVARSSALLSTAACLRPSTLRSSPCSRNIKTLARRERI